MSKIPDDIRPAWTIEPALNCTNGQLPQAFAFVCNGCHLLRGLARPLDLKLRVSAY